MTRPARPGGRPRPGPSLSILDVSLPEPEPLVDGAADLGVQVGGVLVPKLARAVDRLADVVGERPEPLNQQGHVPLAPDRIERILGQHRALGRHPDGARRRPPELHRPLGDRIGELRQLLGDLVEQLVELVELLPLDVPVCLLGLRKQVEDAGQALVELLDQCRPLLDRDVDLGAELTRLTPGVVRRTCTVRGG